MAIIQLPRLRATYGLLVRCPRCSPLEKPPDKRNLRMVLFPVPWRYRAKSRRARCDSDTNGKSR